MAPLTVAITAILFYCILKICLAYVRQPDLPSPRQGPFWRRLFKEPTPDQLVEWALTIPNDGLISFRGALHRKKVLVCSIPGAKIIADAYSGALVPQPGTIKFLEELLGNGLVSAWGDEHKIQRRQLSPVFRTQAIRGLHPIFLKKSRELLEVMQTERAKTPHVEVTQIFNRATLDVIGLAGFGLDFQCLSQPCNELWTVYGTAFGASSEALWARLLHISFPTLHALLGGFLKWHEKTRKAIDTVRGRIKEVIAKKHNEAISNSSDLISLLLHQGLITSTDKLIDQSLTILGAGHDTAASTLSLVLYFLSKHSDKQNALRSEIRSSLPSILKSNDLERLETLPYLNAVITETLRLHPIIPYTPRITTAPTKIGNHILPTGTTLILGRGAIQRSPEIWPHDPSAFHPERWIADTNGGAKDRLAFLGFGAGPRSCIGERFARAEIGCMVAEIMRKFEVEFVGTGHDGKDSEVGLDLGLVLRIRGGLWVKLKVLDEQ